MQSLATSLSCITSGTKLVFSWKDRDSMMRGKFQMNSIQYGELPKQYSYHTEGPWKLYRWNLGESEKPQRCVMATPNQLFPSTTTASVICAKFQAILLDFWNFQKFRDKKESGKMLQSHAISSNLSVVHHKWSKVSFLMKKQWFNDAWKVSNEFDSIWWIAKTIQLPHRRSLKALYIGEILETAKPQRCVKATPN